MNNEEKNLTPENEGVEENKTSAPTEQEKGKKGLSGGLLAAIIGGVAVVILAVILLVVLLPGKDSGNTGDGGEGNGDVQPETKVTYTVTVVDQDGNPVKGAIVYFYPKGGVEMFYPTNDNGATEGYKTDKEMSISVMTVPAGYEYDKLGQKQKVDAKDGKVTITVTKKAPEGTNYTICVVDQNGNPVQGAMVQMCESAEVCLTPVFTDANGEAVYTQPEKEYKAAITNLPDGYQMLTDGYTYFEDYVATIVVTKTAD